MDRWEQRNRRNNFFELVYVLSGKGMQQVNDTRVHYQPGSIFLLPASNCHSYNIAQPTRFLFIRFTANYFSSDNDCVIDFGKWFCRLNFIIGNYTAAAGELIVHSSDKKHIVHLLQLIMEENGNEDVHAKRIMQATMVSVLEIIARNIASQKELHQLYADKRFAGLLLHIQYHLLDEEKISIPFLCNHFHVAASYFSEYFKRNAGENFQDFILRSKLKLAEARALYTDDSFKEIAWNLGFTDSSHLNKMMKRYFQQSMSGIRKKSLAEAVNS